MGELSLFLKENKAKKENAFFAAAKSLKDGGGKPLLWEIRAVTTREDEEFRDACTRFDDEAGRFRLDVNRYMAKLAAASVVYPNLYNAELQNSYGANTPEELIREMLDEPAEYQAFVRFVQKFGETDVSLSERIENAKNS
ncbi:MAG: hypothetical protein LBI38_03650 [Oscillospiraceae bacterium]|jgi:hypothetical protein|nr:hypothetical protein [Oscillospiraceae bacterium]